MAFLIAPAWVPIGIGLYTHEHLTTVVSGLLAYIGTFAVGRPIFQVLRSNAYGGWLSGPVGFLVAMVLSILTWLGFALSLGHNLTYATTGVLDIINRHTTFFILPGILGAFVGVTIWVIARPRPSRTTRSLVP